MFKRNTLNIIIILLIHQVFTVFLRANLFPIHYLNQNLLFLDLIHKNLFFSYPILFVVDALNIIIFWFLGRKFFKHPYSFLPALIYSVSPWGSYLAASGSNYIFYLFLVLINIYGLTLIKSNKIKIGGFLVVISFVFAIYCSTFLLMIFPLVYLCLIITNFISVKELRVYLFVVVLFVIPLVCLIFKNKLAVGNIIANEVGIFSDPGLINTVNSFRGEAMDEHLGLLAKLSENKYIFSVEYVFVKFVRHLVPSTFFTSEEKLLGFSFSPPLYLGFLIPFVFGVCEQLKKKTNRTLLLISCLLIVPSLMVKAPVDLARLLIFVPVVIFFISLGFVRLFEKFKTRSFRYLLAVTFVFLVCQLVLTITDIRVRERVRFERYFGQNYQIK